MMAVVEAKDDEILTELLRKINPVLTIVCYNRAKDYSLESMMWHILSPRNPAGNPPIGEQSCEPDFFRARLPQIAL